MKKLLFLALLATTLVIGSASRVQAQAVFRPGDTIEISLGGVPQEFIAEFNKQYTIDDDGDVNLPYINSVKVGGLQIAQAQALIEQKLKSGEIYTHPTITINQQQTARFVIIGGAVRAPGRIQYTSDLTVMSAINAAGGPSDFAGKRIELIRGGKRSAFDINKLKRDPASDPRVVPGDQITVQQSWF